jgi:hypothetical protein
MDQLGAYHTTVMSHSVSLDDFTNLMSFSSNKRTFKHCIIILEQRDVSLTLVLKTASKIRF